MMYYLFEKLGVEKSAINLPRVRFHKFKTRMPTSIHTNHLMVQMVNPNKVERHCF